MKIRLILILIFSLVILTANSASLAICNLETAKQAIAPRIFSEITIDGANQPVLITRFLHNKLGIFSHELARCYFATIDPNFILKSTSVIGLVTWSYFAYRIFARRVYLMLAIFVFMPIVPFINLPTLAIVFAHKIFAIIGLVFLVKKFR